MYFVNNYNYDKVSCTLTILLDGEHDERIRMGVGRIRLIMYFILFQSSEKDDDDHISPFLSFTDGNTTIENIR